MNALKSSMNALKKSIAELAGRFGISSRFGMRTIGGQVQFHNGIDIACPAGTQIRLPAGEVSVWWDDKYGGGLSCVVHTQEGRFGFAHLSAVQIGPDGSVFVVTGNTGRSTGPHLHFTVYTGQWVDPEQWIREG
jgi:murein DD-endopeptidase MepM/ murein hydrolase activator NlpD